MKRLLIIIISLSICIGVVGLSLNVALGNQTVTYVERHTIPFIHGVNGFYYTFNFQKYIQNLTLSVTDISVLTLDLPTKEWINMTLENGWTALGNNLSLILDYILVAINVLLYPIRIGAYSLKNLMAIVGINMNANDPYNGLNWLVTFVNNAIRLFQIPYI